MKFWQWLPSHWGHKVAPRLIPYFAKLLAPREVSSWHSRMIWNLHFANPLGNAGGFDKNGEMVDALFSLGFGFVEVGTVTPRPQTGNWGSVIDRSWADRALWNRLGFPSQGAQVVAHNLQRAFCNKNEKWGPVFINVGKNRQTPNERAWEDWVEVIKILDPWANAWVFNVSSPNTPGLRNLQNSDYLLRAGRVLRDFTAKPLLFKLSPDMEDSQFEEVVQAALEVPVHGLVLTNTTIQRPPMKKHFPREGGLSGSPLAPLALHALRLAVKVRRKLCSPVILVSCGGILTPCDIEQRLQEGADLVQIYSALVFEGLSLPKNVAHYFHGKTNSNRTPAS